MFYYIKKNFFFDEILIGEVLGIFYKKKSIYII
jgi:hypothetical protein